MVEFNDRQLVPDCLIGAVDDWDVVGGQPELELWQVRLCCLNRSMADVARESLRWQPYLECTDAGRPNWRSRLSMTQPS